jgi:hypothetical protein
LVIGRASNTPSMRSRLSLLRTSNATKVIPARSMTMRFMPAWEIQKRGPTALTVADIPEKAA